MLFVQPCTSASSNPRIHQLILQEQIPASTGTEPLTSASSVHFVSLFLIAVTCSAAPCARAVLQRAVFPSSVCLGTSPSRNEHLLHRSWMVPMRTGLNSIWSWHHSWKVQCFQSMQKALSSFSDDLDVRSLCLIRYLYHSIKNTKLHF